MTLRYQTRADSRIVYCEDCSKNWRHGCAECAELFADYHRSEFGHHVTVSSPHPEDGRDGVADLFGHRRRNQWWER